MRTLLISIILGTLALSPLTAATHPFGVRDMVAMDRLSDPQPSPRREVGGLYPAGHRSRGQPRPVRPLAGLQ